MTSSQALHYAEECRAIAGLLLGIAVAAVITGFCVFYSLGPGFALLFCIVVALVCAIGFIHEMAEARRFDRIARQRLPLHFENHGHE